MRAMGSSEAPLGIPGRGSYRRGFFKGYEFVLSDFGEGLRKWTVAAIREWGRFHDWVA